MRSWVFDRIWIDAVVCCFFVVTVYLCVDADLVHPDVEIYWQNSGLQWVQSFNEMISFLCLLFLRFQRLLRFLSWMKWIVGGFGVDVPTFYYIVSILTVPWFIYLWGCLFVLFYLATGNFHFWYEELWGIIVEDSLLHKD